MTDVVKRLVIDSGAQSAIFHTEAQACQEALRYLEENPDHIVMLVELEMARCDWCDEWIIEKAGWVLHKWIHLRTGAHLCFLKFTQAKPKEVP